MRHIASLPAVLVYTLTACSDRPSPAEPASVAQSSATVAAQGPPTGVEQPPSPVFFCSFPIEVVLSGKEKTIELPGGRMIVTSPGLKVTLTNPANGQQETLNITGAAHLRTLENGDVEHVLTGRGAVFDPFIPGFQGFALLVGRFTYVTDATGEQIVQTLQGIGQQIDICALLA
jgi:hypothetical protein